MVKLWSLRHWRHTFGLIFKILSSRNVAVADKLVFVIPVFLYWICPDIMPFVPIDDIAFTMLVAQWFAGRMSRKYNIG